MNEEKCLPLTAKTFEEAYAKAKEGHAYQPFRLYLGASEWNRTFQPQSASEYFDRLEGRAALKKALEKEAKP